VTVEGRPSVIGRVAIAASVASFIGFLILFVGNIAGIEGAEEGEDGSVIFDIAWICFSLGAIIALITGLLAFFQGRRRGHEGTKRAGRLALMYFALAVVIMAIVASFD